MLYGIRTCFTHSGGEVTFHGHGFFPLCVTTIGNNLRHLWFGIPPLSDVRGQPSGSMIVHLEAVNEPGDAWRRPYTDLSNPPRLERPVGARSVPLQGVTVAIRNNLLKPAVPKDQEQDQRAKRSFAGRPFQRGPPQILRTPRSNGHDANSTDHRRSSRSPRLTKLPP